MELGLYTFGDLGPGVSAAQRTKEILAAAKLADDAGLDVFGVGEHHRLDTLISSPPVMLAAIAQITKRVKLTSATTVLPTVDPVRVFEDFATVDLLSDGRAEILAGRGAFTESYPLFGYDLEQRDALFAEHLELLLRLNESERVTWEGKLRSPLRDAQIAPRPLQKKLPIWVGVGVTPASAIRAGALGLPLNLAILGTSARMKPLVDAYRAAGAEAGHAGDRTRHAVAISSHLHVAEDAASARDGFYAYYTGYFQAMGRPGMPRSDYDAIIALKDGLLIGSADEIAEKILAQHALFRHDRYVGQLDIGGLPYAKVAKAIELFAGKVAPIVRRATEAAR